MPAALPTPQPVVVTTICSLCDQPWEAHGDKPTTADCIRLLKAKIVTTPQPVVIYRDRWPTYPTYTPYWQYSNGGLTLSSAAATTSSGLNSTVVEFRRPDDDDGPQAITSGVN